MEAQNKIDKISRIANGARKSLVKMSENCAKTMHWGGALSCIDILSTLYGEVLKVNGNPSKSDIFILSKGHAGSALYAVLEQIGALTETQLEQYRRDGTKLTELAEYNKELGIECSGGSLGLGLSYAAGIALAMKKKNMKTKVYVLLGDGEINEGSVWEAVMFAAQNHLGNLYAIIDKNDFQSDGDTATIINMEEMKQQFMAFQWDAVDVNGHDCVQIYDALINSSEKKPHAIVAHTIKGRGISFMEGDNSWHDRKINEHELMEAKEEVGLFAES